MGFEPTNGGTTIRCLNRLATFAMFRLNRFRIVTQSRKLSKDPYGKICLGNKKQIMWVY